MRFHQHIIEYSESQDVSWSQMNCGVSQVSSDSSQKPISVSVDHSKTNNLDTIKTT
jgi:hypothetical protein